jgi:mannose-6-phosphate isomerase-like protein (cupin superfamily)
MRVINFGADVAEPIGLFESVASSSVELGHGSGDVHVHCVHFAADAQIGVHPTGCRQLFLVVQGSGWAVGGDGTRVHLEAGQGVFFELGEVHSKGSDGGMIAIMVQASDLQPNDVVLRQDEA